MMIDPMARMISWEAFPVKRKNPPRAESSAISKRLESYFNVSLIVRHLRLTYGGRRRRCCRERFESEYV